MINWKKARKKKTEWIIKKFDLENPAIYPSWIAKMVRFFNETITPLAVNIVIFFLMFKVFYGIYNSQGFEFVIIIMLLIIILMLKNINQSKSDND